jgi:hypothetical protein
MGKSGEFRSAAKSAAWRSWSVAVAVVQQQRAGAGTPGACDSWARHARFSEIGRRYHQISFDNIIYVLTCPRNYAPKFITGQIAAVPTCF